MRVRWFDLHNLPGVLTLAWGLVVGMTGVVNELAVLLDLVTIAVLGGGVYLWLSRRRSPTEERLAELQAAE